MFIYFFFIATDFCPAIEELHPDKVGKCVHFSAMFHNGDFDES